MKLKKIKIFFYLMVFSLFSCVTKQNAQVVFPEKISEIYFQRWIGGQELTGSGIYFHIQLEKPLNQDIKLEKVYFRGNEAVLSKENDTNYKANFFQKNQKDKTLKTDNSLYKLSENQAILTYKINNTTLNIKLENIKEKELIAFPAVGKPRK
ncbi:MAG: hypothetical protein H7195_09275 [Chryseobacterium sp.]|nr:hypothetical protein [Chryseobacterium sp.]